MVYKSSQLPSRPALKCQVGGGLVAGLVVGLGGLVAVVGLGAGLGGG